VAQIGSPVVYHLGQQGMIAHPNSWLSSNEELLVAENCCFENDLVQKEPAAPEYDIIGIATEGPSGTLSGTADNVMLAKWLPATSAVALLGTIFTGVANQTSPWTVTITGSASPGNLLVLGVGQTNNPTDSPVATAVTDSKGNTWTRLGTSVGSGSINADLDLWVSLLTATMTSGVDTITVTFTTAASDARALNVTAFSGVTSTASQTTASGSGDTTTAFGATPFPAYVGTSYPALLIAGLEFNKINTTTPTWTGGFTEAARASSGAVASQLSVAYKVVPFSPAIVAQWDFKADQESSPAGTVSTTANSNTVTGAGTSFTTVYVPGDEIQAGGEVQVVDNVASNTSLTTVARWTTTQSGVAPVRRSGPRVITAMLGGFLFKDAPLSGGNTGFLSNTTLKSGLTKSRRRGRFVQAGKEAAANTRKLFYFNGVDPVQVLAGDAATTTNIATPPSPDWDTVQNPSKQPINGLVHGINSTRLIGFGNLSDPHRIYLSDPANHELFTGTGSSQISLSSNIGERLYGAAEFQGIAFFWKYPNGIFYLDDTDPNFVNWGYHVRSQDLGCCASPHSVLSIDEDVLFMSPDGHVHLLSAVDALGGTRSSDLTRQFGLHTWVRDNVDRKVLDQVTSVWNPATRVALFGCRSLQATTPDNDLLLRWDFGLRDRNGPPRFSYARCWTPNALTQKRRDYIGTPSVLYGGLNSSVFVDPTQYGFTTVKAVTTGISQTVRTPTQDFANVEPANRTKRKFYRAVEIVLAAHDLVSTVMTVQVYCDDTLRETFTITGDASRFKVPLKTSDGYDIQIVTSIPSTSTTDVRIQGMVIWWEPGGEDQSRPR